ncbi:MAG: dihydroorotate dehydrogenase [Anaerolineae bacterium]|nr:dihydroorotate dehydrogenase [Anaerolineae bacterium]MDW8102448.1 dihydroorotate dehydrogenase [Anaerolineae bacterium]
MVNLGVDLCGYRLKNPLVLASGVLGTGPELLARVAEAGAGAVTTKSCSLAPRRGHPNPTVLEWGHGLINAVGLANPGAEAMARIIAEAKKLLAPLKTPIIASIFGSTIEEFARTAHIISSASPDFIEVNISCPNVEEEFGRPFAADPEAAAKVTRAVKAVTSIPVIVKLSPNVTDIAEVACAVEEAGADAICAINTVAGMLIDVYAGRPILANRTGGLSGPAIKPIALRCVYEITQNVKIPVIGTGGVTTGKDALEMIMAGATAVGVGSAVYYRGLQAFNLIQEELADLMQKLGYRSIEEVRGIAHRS